MRSEFIAKLFMRLDVGQKRYLNKLETREMLQEVHALIENIDTLAEVEMGIPDN